MPGPRRSLLPAARSVVVGLRNACGGRPLRVRDARCRPHPPRLCVPAVKNEDGPFRFVVRRAGLGRAPFGGSLLPVHDRHFRTLLRALLPSSSSLLPSSSGSSESPAASAALASRRPSPPPPPAPASFAAPPPPWAPGSSGVGWPTPLPPPRPTHEGARYRRAAACTVLADASPRPEAVRFPPSTRPRGSRAPRTPPVCAGGTAAPTPGSTAYASDASARARPARGRRRPCAPARRPPKGPCPPQQPRGPPQRRRSPSPWHPACGRRRWKRHC